MSETTVKITRIDLRKNPQGVFVEKYAEGWHASSRPAKDYLNTEMDLDEMVAWLKEQGWTVHCWPGGARAWWGHVLPVRTRWAIRYLRDFYSHRKDALPKGVQLHAVDLAYDL